MSFSRQLSVSTLLATVLAATATTYGADIIKANNATQISNTGSWVGGALPTINDTAVINSTFTETNSFGTGPAGHTTTKYFGLRVEGIIATPPGPNHVNISNTANANYVGIGAGGIDIANGNRNLTIANLNAFADQTWNVGANTLTVGGSFLRSIDHTVAATASPAQLSVNIQVIGTGGQLTIGNNNSLNKGLSLTGVRLNASFAGSLGANSTISQIINDTAQAYLNANVTYTGSLTVAGNGWIGDTQSLGALRFQNAATLGGNLTLAGDALISAYNSTGTIAGIINDNGTAHTLRIGAANDTGVLTLSGSVAHSGVTTITGGTVKLGLENVFTSTSKVSIDGGTFDLNGFNNTIDVLTIINGHFVNSDIAAQLIATTYDARGGSINATLGGATSKLIKTTTGTTVINAPQTYGGGTEINEGTLQFGAANVLAPTSEVSIDGGTLDLNSNNNQIGQLVLKNGSVINSVGSATLTAVNYDVRNGAISAVLGGAASTLTKSTTGAVILSGANTYGGLTSVNEGSLIVSTVHGGGGAFSVNGGANLGISLNPADATLDISTLTLNGGSLSFDLGSSANPANFLVDADILALNALTQLNITGSGLSVGQFALLHYDNFNGGFGNFDLNNLPARTLAELVHNIANKTIDLKINGIDLPRWDGNLSANWDTTTTNWKLNSDNVTTTTYLQGAGGNDSVLFNDNAAGQRNVNLVGTLTPSGITVNTASNYQFSGAGKLGGTTSIIKQGTGLLTITNTGGNDFTGGIVVQNGTVRIGDGATLGAGTAGSGVFDLATPGTLEFLLAAGDDHTLSNLLLGTGTFAQKGANLITLTGNNENFNGHFLVTAGTLKAGHINAFGSADIKVQSGGALDVTDQSIDNAIELDAGNLQTTSGNANDIDSVISLANTGGSFNTLNGSSLTINQIISGTGGLTKGGDGVLQLLAGNTYQGITTLNAGTLRLGHNNALGATGNASRTIVNASATLDLAGRTIAETLELNQGGKLANTTGNAVVSSSVTTSGINAIEVSTGATTTLSGGVSGTGSIDKQGGGRLFLNGANTYEGGTTLISGSIVFGSLSAIPSIGSISPAAGTTVGFGFSIDQTTLSRITPNANAFTIGIGVNTSGNLDFSSFTNASLGSIANVTFSGNIITNGPNFLFGGGDAILTVASNITGTRGIVINAANGSVVLSGNNSHLGTTTVSSGTLVLGSATALGSQRNTLALLNTAGFNTTVDLNGHSIKVGGLTAPQTPQGYGKITDNSVGAGITTIEVNSVANSTFGSALRDGSNGKKLSLVKTGAATLIFNGAGSGADLATGGQNVTFGNNFSGGIYLKQGTLDFRINTASVTPRGSSVYFDGSSTLLGNVNGNVNGRAEFDSVHFRDGIGLVTLARNNANANAAIASAIFRGTTTRQIGAAGNFNITGTSLGDSYSFSIADFNLPYDEILNRGIYYNGADFAALSFTGILQSLLYYNPNDPAGTFHFNTFDANLSSDIATLADTGGTITDTDLQLRGTGHITGQTTESVNTLKIAGANNITLANGATFSVNSLLKAGGVSAVNGTGTAQAPQFPAVLSESVISGGTGLTVSDLSSDFIIRTNTDADFLTIHSKILASVVNGITKSGRGTLTLTADNDYNGITNILEGVIKITQHQALGNTGNTNRTRIHSYGLLDYAGLNPGQSDEELELVNGAIGNSDTTNATTLNNTIVLNGGGQLHPYADAILNVESIIQGNGVLYQTGPGRTFLKSDNTFTGDIHVTAGSLVISRTQQLGLGSKIIRIAGDGSSTFQPLAALAVPRFDIDGSAGDLTFASNVEFHLGANAGATTPSGLVNVAGNNTILGHISMINAGSGQGRIYVEGGLLTINGNIDAQAATGDRTLLIGGSAAGQGVINGNISDTKVDNAVTNVVSVSKDGPGTWTLNGNNTFTGNLTIIDGTVKVGNIAATGSPTAGAVTIGNANSIGTQAIFDYIGSLDAVLQRQITASAGTSQAVIRNSSGHLLTLAGTIARNTRTLSFEQGNIAVTGAITGTNAASHTIIDGSTVTFSNIGNNYGGSTTIKNGGILKNGASNVLPNGTTIILGDATSNSNGTYDLNGFDETVTTVTNAGTGQTIVTNSGATAITNTLSISGAGTFGGRIRDGDVAKTALTKTTGGVFTLTGSNTYTGPTNVNGGTLALAATGQLASNVNVASAATLDVLGEISGAVQVNADGNLRIGSAGLTGLATLGTSLTLSDTSHVYFDINGADRGAATNGYDTINGLDFVTLDGTFHVAFNNPVSFVENQVFQLIDWTTLLTPGAVVNNGYNFDFSAADVSSLGLSWITDSFHINGTISLGVVPEPARAILFMMGIAMLAQRRRRHSSRLTHPVLR